ncbi:MAG: aminoacyl-tRNA hydrolase [Planctomycetaceae bacterium]
MKIVVGLGNPGRKYEGTRHNLGFEVVSLLGQRFAASTPRVKFEAELAEILIGDERILLVAPQTYMNLSGRSVRQTLDFYKLTPATDLLVISDDLNLPTGQVRLRGSGTAGGQKGLQNIIDQLGGNQFARLRIGIDRPAGGRDVTDYVLQKFSRSERDRIDPALQLAADGVEYWVKEGLDKTMSRVNGRLDP